MFCTKCGEVLADDAVFCTACGEPVEAENSGEAAQGGGSLPSGSKKSLSKKTTVILGTVAAVAACGAIVGAVLWNRPEVVILRGLKNTAEAACTQESGVAEYLGVNKIKKMLVSGDSRQTVTFEGAIGSSDMGLTSAGVGIDWQLDKSRDGKISGRASGTVANMDVMNLEFYNDQEITVVGIPDLYRKYFYLNHDELAEKLESSKFRSMLKDNFNIDISGDLSKEELEAVMGYWETSRAEWKALAKNTKIVKLDKKKFSIGGKSKACKGYELTIPNDDMEGVMESYFNYLSDNDYILNSLSAMTSSSSADVKQGLKTMRKELAKAMRDDLVIRLYIGPKGRIVYAEGEYSLRIDSETVNMEGSIQMTGVKNPLDSLKLEAEGRTGFGSLRFSAERDLKDEKDRLKDSLELEGSIADRYGNRASCRTTAEGELEKGSGEWNIELGLVVPGFQSSFLAEGSVEDLKKGSQFNILLDDVTIKAYDTTAPVLEIEGSYGVEPLKEAVVNPAGDAKTLNVLKLSEDDWYDIGREIEDNMYRETGSYMGGWGFGGSSSTLETTAAATEAWDQY